MASDMFDAADQIYSAIRGLEPDEAKKAILMALIAKGMPGILVDPNEFEIMRIPPRVVT